MKSVKKSITIKSDLPTSGCVSHPDAQAQYESTYVRLRNFLIITNHYGFLKKRDQGSRVKDQGSVENTSNKISKTKFPTGAISKHEAVFGHCHY